MYLCVNGVEAVGVHRNVLFVSWGDGDGGEAGTGNPGECERCV